MQALLSGKDDAPIPTIDRYTGDELEADVSWNPDRLKQRRMKKFVDELVNEVTKRKTTNSVGRVIVRRTIKSRVRAEAKESADELEQTYQALAAKWREETGHISSITKLVMHPCYQRIIGLGPAVLPILLRELQREPDYWFWALEAITGENPVDDKDMGNVPRMAEAWLNWARRRENIDVDPPRVYFQQPAKQ